MPVDEHPAAQDRSCSKCGYKGNARPCPDPDCPSRTAAACPECGRLTSEHGANWCIPGCGPEPNERRDQSAASPSLRLVSVEHFEGDGRIVSRVWQTFHWLTVAGDDTPDQINVDSLIPAVPETIYSEQGRALR